MRAVVGEGGAKAAAARRVEAQGAQRQRCVRLSFTPPALSVTERHVRAC